MSNNVEAISQVVPMREKVAFGLGDIGTNFYLQTIAVFLIFFYTDVLGISAVLAGSIMLICRLFEAFTDMFIGFNIDRTGNTKKWLIYGASISVVLFILMFLSPNFSEGGKYAYALITFAMWTVAYTCYGIPVNTLASTITPDQKQRMSLNSVRFPFIAIPILIATAATPVLVGWLTPSIGVKAAYPVVFGSYAVIGLILAFVCVKVVKERAPIVRNNDAEKLKFKDVVKSFSGNKPAVIAVLIFFLYFLQYYTGQASLAYYFAYVLKNSEILSLYALSSLPLMVVGMILSGKLCTRIGKRPLVFWIGIIITFTYLLRYIFATSLAAQIIASCIFSIVAGLMCVICYNMVGDAVTYAYFKTGKLVVAVFYSTAIFSQKVSMALCGVVVGCVLAASGYVANVAQTSTAIFGIMSIYSLIPALLGLITGLVGLGWSIDKHECFRQSAVEKETSAVV